MNFFKRLFSRNKPLIQIQCPRCLGKGHVDTDDIKRLEKELYWRPGKCAYCNGNGNVDEAMPGKVAVDEAYLTTDLSRKKREGLINQDKEAMEEKNTFYLRYETSLKQIRTLYFAENLSIEEIADFYLGARRSITTSKERDELIEYINKVIVQKK